MRSRLKIPLVVLVCLFLIALVALLTISIVSHAYTPPPLPQPNGYTGIVQAGQAMRADAADFETMDERHLQAIVRSNSVAMQIVRSNLNLKTQVPVGYSLNYLSAHIPELSAFKRIAFGLVAEGKLAEIQHRPADAARSYVDAIRLGVKCCHGGVLIDALVGIAVENIGSSELQKVVSTLDEKTCKDTAQELEKIEAQRDTWNQILQQEHYWSAKAFPGFPNFVTRLVSFNSTRKAEAKAEQKYEIPENNTRKLMLNLAARAYALEKGHPPNSMADLIPAFLDSIPIDPTTGLAIGLPAGTQALR